jgi:L-histidine N-alpha-methyltransferase
MHLVSERQQLVRVGEADLEIEFQKDEWIWTESSYKYEPNQVLADGRRAGFRDGEQWIDHDARFALTLFRA